MTVAFATECAHCARSLRIEVDSELRCRVADEAAEPLAFVPLVNFAKLKAANIIDDF